MTAVLLDSGVVGDLVKPAPPRELHTWFVGALSRGRRFFVPEVVDYEVRRKLLHVLPARVIHLDGLLEQGCEYLPLDTAAIRHAATCWASLRRAGLKTAADESLDVDCLLAGQALALRDVLPRPVVIATLNVRHLGRLVDAAHWQDIR